MEDYGVDSKKIKKSHNVSKQDVGKEVEEQQQPPWSDLHTYLLDEIVSKLCYVDQVVFHAVCKGWHAAQYKTTPADFLRWAVRVWRPSLDMFQCQLYAKPINSPNPDPIPVQNIYLDQFVSSYPLCFDNDIHINTKYGWLLFFIPTRDYTATTFLFYSPLTKRVVVLPPLTHSRGANCKLTTASSAPPDSPDFVLFVLKRSDIDTMNTYCHRDGEWNTKQLDVYYLENGELPRAFIHKSGCKNWGNHMRVHNRRTFWVQPPARIVTRKQ